MKTNETITANTPITQAKVTGKRRIVRVVLILLIILSCSAAGFWLNNRPKENKGGGGAREEAAVPVKAMPISHQNIPVQIRALGNVEATSIVAVKSMINGELTKIHFQPGQEVKKGDLLFSIDSRSLMASLDQAKAALAKDEAIVKQAQSQVARDRATQQNNQREADRYQQLYNQGISSREVVEKYQADALSSNAVIDVDLAAVKSAEASTAADRAAIANAELQLNYATIYAPTSGRTGNLDIYVGNLIRANDTTPLVTIAQVAPIYITFSVPEKELANINLHRKEVTVEAFLPNDEAHPLTGTLSFIDNSVDQTTGTIKLKATFDNHEQRLWPGQFINVVMTLTTNPNALVVPSEAVQTSQDGKYIYVIVADKAELRPVTTGITINGVTVIEKGLTDTDTVITDGQLRLSPGAKVTVKTNNPDKGDKANRGDRANRGDKADKTPG